MKRVIYNQKGGVGKTSIACNLAAAMAKSGKKVLLVDLDAQCNATQYILGEDIRVGRTLADFFASILKVKLYRDSLISSIHETSYENLYIIPASPDLGDLLSKLENKYKVLKLRQAIDAVIEIEGFDEVVFDTPPALNFYSMSAMIASERILIPFDCDAFSAKALDTVVDTIEDVQDDYQPELKLEGVIINHFQAQASLPKSIIDSLLMQGYPVLSPFLSASIVMKESHGRHLPLVHYRPGHKVAKEYMQLASNLMKTGKRHVLRSTKKESVVDRG